MNALDSPLALNYLSYGLFMAINKMLAAVTAAFSFWRTGPSSPPRPEHRALTKDAASSTSFTPPIQIRGPEEVADDPAKLLSTRGGSGTNRVSSLETDQNTTKGKFVLYYRNDGFRELGGAEPVDDDGVGAFRRWSAVDWERKMEIRMGGRDMGWYRCQDLAALNGSVVRLWDGCGDRVVAIY